SQSPSLTATRGSSPANRVEAASVEAHSSLLESLRLERSRNARTKFGGLALIVEVEPDGLDYSTRLVDRHAPIGFRLLGLGNDVQIFGLEGNGACGVVILCTARLFGLAMRAH